MKAKKYSLFIFLIKVLAISFTLITEAAMANLELKSGDVIAIQGEEKDSFCYVNNSAILVCNQKKNVTERSLFKVKIINRAENIIALSVGPDFTNYCQYDDSSRRVLCDYEDEQPGSWEWFQFVPINSGSVENKFALKSGTTGYRNFCSETEGNITCDKNYLDDQGTTFQYHILQKEGSQENNLVDLANIAESLRSSKLLAGEIKPDLYLSQDSSGTPAVTESTEAPAITESTEAPAITESTETPAATESTEAPAATESTETPAATESTEAPATVDEGTEAPATADEGTEAPAAVTDEGTEAPAAVTDEGTEAPAATEENITNTDGSIEEAGAETTEQNTTDNSIIQNLESQEKIDTPKDPIHSDCTVRNWEQFKPNLAGCDLKFIDFKGKDLKGWDFSHAKLNFTQFEGSDLSSTKFDDAELNNTNFKGANLKGAHFRGAKIISVNFELADMRYVKFEEATVEATTFAKANLSDAYFVKTSLKNNTFDHAKMNYVQMICDAENKTFDQAKFPNTFHGVDFKKSNLEHCNLSNTNLSKINFYKADLAYINLIGSNLKETDFEKANLSHSNFEKADLSGADMEDTVIFHTSFKDANLTKALIDTEHVLESDFTGANLDKAIFKNTGFIECDFTNQDLNKVKFKGKVSFLSCKMEKVLLHKKNLINVNLLGSKLSGAKLKSFTFTFKNLSKKHFSKLCVSYNSFDQVDNVRRGQLKCTPNLRPGHHSSIEGIPGDATHVRAMVTGDNGQNIGGRTWNAIDKGKECTAKGILFDQAASCN